jgi:hypothetical protein
VLLQQTFKIIQGSYPDLKPILQSPPKAGFIFVIAGVPGVSEFLPVPHRDAGRIWTGLTGFTGFRRKLCGNAIQPYRMENQVKKTATIIQIAIVSLLIIYGTVNLFLGHFEGALVTFPFLLFYYVYIVARLKRERKFEDDEGDNKGS